MTSGVPDLSPLWLSLEAATGATIFLFVFGVPAAWSLSRPPRSPFRAGHTLIFMLITLPLVLPPTVVGFLLLMLLGRGSGMGRFINDVLHIRWLFTLPGATLAAFVMAFPLFVRTAAAAFAAVDGELCEVARTLGAREIVILRHVVLPLSFRGLAAAAVLGWARAFGEFGATLMVAGNIPGETQTLPLAIYGRVESGDYASAWFYTGIVGMVTLAALLFVETAQNRVLRRRGF